MMHVPTNILHIAALIFLYSREPSKPDDKWFVLLPDLPSTLYLALYDLIFQYNENLFYI